MSFSGSFRQRGWRGQGQSADEIEMEVSSDCLWPETAGAVNDNHQVNDSVAICGLGLSVWMGSVSACAPVHQGGGKTDLLSSLSQALPQKTATLHTDRPPAFCFYLPSPTNWPSERISAFTKHVHIITFDFPNNPERQAPQAGHQDNGGYVTCPTGEQTITEAIIIINKKNDSSNGHLSGGTL